MEPLLLKKSLSVSSLLKFSPEKETAQEGRYQRGFSPQRHLVPGSTAPLQRGDDFWDSLCTHYNYLMDEGLIATCREANSELSSKVEGDCDWSFTEFIQKFNELHDTLHILLEEVLCITHAKDDKATVGVLEKLQTVVFACKQFKEQAKQLGQRYPDMKDEINRRVNLLNNKWDTLEQAIHPHKPQPTQEALYNEVTHEMRCLRRWLRDVEDRLLPASDGSTGWTLDHLQVKHQGQQVLQKEIESRGQLVSSLLHLCERLQQESSTHGPGGADELSCDGGSLVASRLPWDAERICRVASNLEKRWHALWLRSLEEQCKVEELIRKCKAGLLPSDPSLESSFGEEPPQKYPRLTGSFWSPPLTSRRTMSRREEEEVEADREQRHNDKAVMVGSTGIAELKAEYGTSPFGRFEIIQDVGYSSESSTHLSGEDNHEFIQVYSYSPATKGRTIVTEYKVCRDTKGGKTEDNPSPPPPPLDVAMEWQLTSEEDDDLFLDNLQPALTSSPTPGSSDEADKQVDLSAVSTLVDPGDGGTFSVRELVSQAEKLVRDDSRKRGRGLQNEQPVAREKFLSTDRVQEWLQGCSGKATYACVGEEVSSAQNVATSSIVLPPEKDIARGIESSCDASGEYTTNDSSDNSGSESGVDGAVQRRLSHSGTGSVETVVPLVSSNTGVGENLDCSPSGCRVVLRSKKRNKRDRPWSVTELYQASSQLGLSPFSTSEGALNVLGTSRLVQGSSLRPQQSPSQDQIVPHHHSPLRRHHRRHRSRASLPLQVHGSSSSQIQTEGQSSGSDGHNSSRRGYSEGSGSHRHLRTHNTSSDSVQCSSQGSCRSRHESSSHSAHSWVSAHNGRNKKRKPVSSDETTKARERMVTKNTTEVSSIGAETIASQLEDQSSVSDQAWDSYEDPPYLSEPYSEQTPDAEQIKRLIDFGDDYRAFICSDASSSVSGRTANRTIRGRTITNNTQGSPGVESETDSEVEELQCLLQDSSSALQFARNTLRSQKKTDTGMLEHTESVELLATCQTHLKCLQVISQHLDPSYHLFSSNSHENLLQDLLSGWEMLQFEVLSSQENGDQFQEVQQELEALTKKMAELSEVLEQNDNKYASMDDIQKRINTLQDSLSLLHETKTWLLSVNLKVHRFLTENGLTYSTMKDSITHLYASWDDIYEQSGSRLTLLQEAYNRWQHFNEDRMKLEGILAQEELEQISLGKVDYWQVAERSQSLSQAEDLLVFLHQEAQLLRPVLSENSQAWTGLKEHLQLLADRLHTIKEDHPQRVQDLLRVKPEVKEAIPVVRTKVASTKKVETPSSNDKRQKRSRFWRVLRTALPLQVAMVLLYCLAWLMEPQCCDFLNSMHFTFSPTLRYLKGPPPT